MSTKPHDPASGTREAGQEAKAVAADAAQQAKAQVDQHVVRAKDGLADEVHDTARALRTAAEEMRTASPQERTMAQIADGLADACGALREKDLGQMAGDLTRFARNNPVAFLGGCALVGFAAARFTRTSAMPLETEPSGTSSTIGASPAPSPAPAHHSSFGETR